MICQTFPHNPCLHRKSHYYHDFRILLCFWTFQMEEPCHLIIVPDKELHHCPFTALQDWRGRLIGQRFHVSYIPCLLLLDRVVQNEQAALRRHDDLEFERTQSRKGRCSSVWFCIVMIVWCHLHCQHHNWRFVQGQNVVINNRERIIYIFSAWTYFSKNVKVLMKDKTRPEYWCGLCKNWWEVTSDSHSQARCSLLQIMKHTRYRSGHLPGVSVTEWHFPQWLSFRGLTEADHTSTVARQLQRHVEQPSRPFQSCLTWPWCQQCELETGNIPMYHFSPASPGLDANSVNLKQVIYLCYLHVRVIIVLSHLSLTPADWKLETGNTPVLLSPYLDRYNLSQSWLVFTPAI